MSLGSGRPFNLEATEFYQHAVIVKLLVASEGSVQKIQGGKGVLALGGRSGRVEAALGASASSLRG